MLLLKKWSIYNIIGEQCYGDNFLHTTYLLYWHSSSPAFKKLFPLCFSVSASHLNPGALVDCKKVRGRYSIRQRTAVQRIFLKRCFAWHFLLWIERFYTVHHYIKAIHKDLNFHLVNTACIERRQVKIYIFETKIKKNGVVLCGGCPSAASTRIQSTALGPRHYTYSHPAQF